MFGTWCMCFTSTVMLVTCCICVSQSHQCLVLVVLAFHNYNLWRIISLKWVSQVWEDEERMQNDRMLRKERNVRRRRRRMRSLLNLKFKYISLFPFIIFLNMDGNCNVIIFKCYFLIIRFHEYRFQIFYWDFQNNSWHWSV